MRIGIERNDYGKRELVISRSDTLSRETSETEEASPFAFGQQLGTFWDVLSGTAFAPQMIDFLWVADRCIQLNAQQVAHMPLRFNGAFPNSVEPAWLANPDPVWYPNGVSDALHSAVDDYYRYGDAFLFVTDFYASGFAAAWTVLDSGTVSVELGPTGRRVFRVGSDKLDEHRVIQITRNPRGGLRGTSALKSYADMVNATKNTMIAGSEAIANSPSLVLQALKKLDAGQAQKIQDQWIDAAGRRRPGTPPIIPPELKLEGTDVRFSPKDLALVENQEFNARILASAFGVPPFLINIALTGGLTYQNPKMLGEYWWRTELFSTCSSFARACSSQMLPAGNSVWFDPKHLTDELAQQGGVDESPAVKASPSDQLNVQPLRPGMEVV